MSSDDTRLKRNMTINKFKNCLGLRDGNCWRTRNIDFSSITVTFTQFHPEVQINSLILYRLILLSIINAVKLCKSLIITSHMYHLQSEYLQFPWIIFSKKWLQIKFLGTLKNGVKVIPSIIKTLSVQIWGNLGVPEESNLYIESTDHCKI